MDRMYFVEQGNREIVMFHIFHWEKTKELFLLQPRLRTTWKREALGERKITERDVEVVEVKI